MSLDCLQVARAAPACCVLAAAAAAYRPASPTLLPRSSLLPDPAVELFFDPQAHTARGIPFSTFFPGLQRAAAAAPQRHGLTAALFMCFLRDLGPAAAADTLAEAAPFLHAIAGVGLDSAELGHPPLAFAGVFSQAAALGLHRVAHAGACVGWLAAERCRRRPHAGAGEALKAGVPLVNVLQARRAGPTTCGLLCRTCA